MIRTLAIAPLAALAACAQAAQPVSAPAATPVYGYRVAGTFPHDRDAFTQGLFWHDGHLYESTGHVGRSTIRKVNLADGGVVQSVPIPPGLFGEGIVNWGPQILSITWRDQVGFRWDRESLKQVGSFSYRGEGWGLTQDGRNIIMSDGTADLRFLDPATMQERRRVTVTDAGAPVPRLNELEFVKGEIFANIWLSPRIARIDPASGRVTGWIDLQPLVVENQAGDVDAVLNGIAYDPARDRLFVTGKNWSRLYEIDLKAPAAR